MFEFRNYTCPAGYEQVPCIILDFTALVVLSVYVILQITGGKFRYIFQICTAFFCESLSCCITTFNPIVRWIQCAFATLFNNSNVSILGCGGIFGPHVKINFWYATVPNWWKTFVCPKQNPPCSFGWDSCLTGCLTLTRATRLQGRYNDPLLSPPPLPSLRPVCPIKSSSGGRCFQICEHGHYNALQSAHWRAHAMHKTRHFLKKMTARYTFI